MDQIGGGTNRHTDGLVRLGYLLDDQQLIEKGEEGIIYILTHADSTGRLPHATFKKASMWPMAVFWRAIKAYYEKTGNAELLERCEVAWNGGKFGDLTEDVKSLSDEVVYLDLVPYGGTELRLTVFPIVK